MQNEEQELFLKTQKLSITKFGKEVDRIRD